ncbi:Chromosome partition protein smc [hydrothermal vent metagenome]|uniref:Chromosome partition protein smc n=1 Tax=hydrothermal vent metagenome TaxID=652676 RepID=A0A3B1D0D4_9ZZZZ
MYLSKLEIFGFKSFANKTVINFNRGITGIVGPNGCGKTNIIDGIRWVLGEQKSSTLRSDKMENVIFNGTRKSKPMGMAEISLTLVNDKGILPTEYSEVTITRRIFRSGESEYLLNKNICRLKDITNLFMDTGMGTNAYSVIELKMIETILSSKADERRHLFEEAAGVNKYKLRRRLTLKRLDDVKSDLTRLNDIVSEVQKTVNSLSRQAKKADKYNQIHSILREKELDLAEREYSKFTLELSQLQETKIESDKQKEEIDLNTRNIENELISFRDKISSIEYELNGKRQELSDNTNKLHDKERNISVAQERDKVLRRNLDNYRLELEEFNFQKIENESTIETSKQLLTDYENQVREKQAQIDERHSVLETKKDELENFRESVKTETEKLNELERKISQIENKINNTKDLTEKSDIEIQKLNKFIQDTTSNIAKTVGYLEELTQEREDVERKIAESDAEYVAKENEKKELEAHLNDLHKQELEGRNIIAGIKNKIELIQSLVANLEGVSKGSKVLLENSSWTENDRTIVADVGNTNEKYRLALNAALKDVLNNLFIEHLDDLKNAIEYLKKYELGKASFYLLKKPNTHKGLIAKLTAFDKKRKAKKLTKGNQFIGWASEFVDTSDKWKPYFENLLANIAVTKDLESAVSLNEKYPQFSFVTLEGDFVQSNGVVEAGSSPQLDETLFGRRQLLEDLKNEYPKYEEDLRKISEQIAQTEDKLESINLYDLSDQGRTLLNDINNIEKQISQIEFEKKKANEEIENAQRKINDFVSESFNQNSILDDLQNEYQSLALQRENIHSELKAKLNEQKEHEAAYNELLDQFNQSKLELERLFGQLQNTKEAIRRSEENREKIDHSIAKRENDISNTEDELVSLQNIIDENQIELDELKAVREQHLSDEKSINERLQAIKNESAQLERQLTDLRHNRQQLSDKIHSIEVKMSENRMRLDNLMESIQEDYSITLELKEFEDADEFNFEEVSAEVHSLKQQAKNLGPVNLLAYSEYEEEAERLDFLLKQRDDLIESEKDLINTINEINEAAQTVFIETFEQIRTNFKKIFESLFDTGDEADLTLQEGVDPLEAKIEIMAKPKGKRPSSIEQLSGGEKTLTATALLFAIYLVKPSPFCIMDEVDAPLDDANVDRFCKLLEDFSDNTQFIIVTHNKRTMNVAETMYGVTMQEEGISKLAGVRFTEDIQV